MAGCRGTRWTLLGLLVAACGLLGSACAPADPAAEAQSSTASPSSTLPPVPDWANAPETMAADGMAFYNGSPAIGTVVAYGDPESYIKKDDLRWLVVEYQVAGKDGAPPTTERHATKIALVEPLDISTCGGPEGKTAAARAALTKVLPIGSRALFFGPPGEDLTNDSVIHRLPGTGNRPIVALPLGSVNEQLAASGTWIPDIWESELAYDVGQVAVGLSESDGGQLLGTSPGVFELRRMPVSAEYAVYRQRIVDAANKALKTTAAGRSCVTYFKAYVAYQIKLGVKSGRDDRANRVAYERYLANLPPCRDGDGDGICYED